MGRYTGPKLKKSKRVRAPISDTTKHMKAELENGPGVHGARRRGKTTIYGDRLREKQKLAFFYSVADRQFRRYMAEATRVKTNTGHKLNELLERRLDNVLRRDGDDLADTRHCPGGGRRRQFSGGRGIDQRLIAARGRSTFVKHVGPALTPARTARATRKYPPGNQ